MKPGRREVRRKPREREAPTKLGEREEPTSKAWVVALLTKLGAPGEQTKLGRREERK
jgi:hypothetical protein